VDTFGPKGHRGLPGRKATLGPLPAGPAEEFLSTHGLAQRERTKQRPARPATAAARLEGATGGEMPRQGHRPAERRTTNPFWGSCGSQSHQRRPATKGTTAETELGDGSAGCCSGARGGGGSEAGREGHSEAEADSGRMLLQRGQGAPDRTARSSGTASLALA
jgi:hypothetical protein